MMDNELKKPFFLLQCTLTSILLSYGIFASFRSPPPPVWPATCFKNVGVKISFFSSCMSLRLFFRMVSLSHHLFDQLQSLQHESSGFSPFLLVVEHQMAERQVGLGWVGWEGACTTQQHHQITNHFHWRMEHGASNRECGLNFVSGECP